MNRKQSFSAYSSDAHGRQLYGYCSGDIPCTYLIDLTSLMSFGFHRLATNVENKIFVPFCPDIACQTRLDESAPLPSSRGSGGKKRKMESHARATKELKDKLAQYLAKPNDFFYKYFTAKLYVVNPRQLDAFKWGMRCTVCSKTYILNDLDKNKDFLPKVIDRSVYDEYYRLNPTNCDYNKTYRSWLKSDLLDIPIMGEPAEEDDDELESDKEDTDDDVAEVKEAVPLLVIAPPPPVVKKARVKKIKHAK